MATLNRRPEPYHETILAYAAGDAQGLNETAAVSDDITFKQDDLHLQLEYDKWPRKSLVDHFLPVGISMEDFQAGRGFTGETEVAVFQTTLKRTPYRAEVVLSRRCQWGRQTPKLTKTIALETSAPSQLEINYTLEDLTLGETIHFAVEFNFAAMASDADDRFYYGDQGTPLGHLGTELELEQHSRIGLVDEWLGLDASLETSQPAGIWAYPLRTVSQSEAGFELVHQSCAVILHWEFTPTESTWQTSINMLLDTSAAQARRLTQTAKKKTVAIES